MHRNLVGFLPFWSWEQLRLLQLLATYSTNIGCGYIFILRNRFVLNLWKPRLKLGVCLFFPADLYGFRNHGYYVAVHAARRPAQSGYSAWGRTPATKCVKKTSLSFRIFVLSRKKTELADAGDTMADISTLQQLSWGSKNGFAKFLKIC